MYFINKYKNIEFFTVENYTYRREYRVWKRFPFNIIPISIYPYILLCDGKKWLYTYIEKLTARRSIILHTRVILYYNTRILKYRIFYRAFLTNNLFISASCLFNSKWRCTRDARRRWRLAMNRFLITSETDIINCYIFLYAMCTRRLQQRVKKYVYYYYFIYRMNIFFIWYLFHTYIYIERKTF